MAVVPTLFVVAFTTDPFRGLLAVGVVLALIVGSATAIYGWIIVCNRIASAQPFGETHWFASGGITIYWIGFLMPGMSVVVVLAILFSLSWRQWLGNRVFVEPNKLPVTLEPDPRRTWFGGAFLVLVLGLIIWDDLRRDAGDVRDIILGMVLLLTLPTIANRRQRQIDFTREGIDLPRFPAGRRFIRYQDIESAFVASHRAGYFVRLKTFSHSQGPTFASLGRPVDNLSDLAAFVEKKAREARASQPENLPAAPEQKRPVFDIWTIGLLVGFNLLAVAIPLYRGSAIAAALIALFIAFIGQMVALPLAMFADSSREKREQLMFALAILYYGLFKLNGLLEFSL